MRNRRKTLLRDHSVPEVTLKTCPRHYSVSAVPETLTVQGPKRPPGLFLYESLNSNSGNYYHSLIISRKPFFWTTKDFFTSEDERSQESIPTTRLFTVCTKTSLRRRSKLLFTFPDYASGNKRKKSLLFLDVADGSGIKSNRWFATFTK